MRDTAINFNKNNR